MTLYMPPKLQTTFNTGRFRRIDNSHLNGIVWKIDPREFAWIRGITHFCGTRYRGPNLDSGLTVGYAVLDKGAPGSNGLFERPVFWLKDYDVERSRNWQKGQRPLPAIEATPTEKLYVRGGEGFHFGEPTVDQAFEDRERHDKGSLSKQLADVHSQHQVWYKDKAKYLLQRWEKSGLVEQEPSGWYVQR